MKVITANNAKCIVEYEKKEKITARFPENGCSPYEQIERLEWTARTFKDWDKPFVLATFSPYILNYLNVLIADGTLNRDNLQVVALSISEKGELVEHDLLGTDENGVLMVDTYDLSEPMEFIFSKYNDLLNAKKE